MNTSTRFASLLVIALAPLSACMDATGENEADLDVGTIYPAGDNPIADVDQRALAGDETPTLGHLVGAKVSCRDGLGVVAAYTTAPAQELELRMAPVFRAPTTNNGHFGQVRESILLEPALHAPSSQTYYWTAEVALGDQTCEDWKAQIEEIRARFDQRFEIGHLRDRVAFGYEPRPAPTGDIAPVNHAATMDNEGATGSDPTDTTGTDTGVIYGHETRPIAEGPVAPLPERASADN